MYRANQTFHVALPEGGTRTYPVRAQVPEDLVPGREALVYWDDGGTEPPTGESVLRGFVPTRSDDPPPTTQRAPRKRAASKRAPQ